MTSCLNDQTTRWPDSVSDNPVGFEPGTRQRCGCFPEPGMPTRAFRNHLAAWVSAWALLNLEACQRSGELIRPPTRVPAVRRVFTSRPSRRECRQGRWRGATSFERRARFWRRTRCDARWDFRSPSPRAPLRCDNQPATAMIDGFQFIGGGVIGGGALLIALVVAAGRAVRRQRPRVHDLGVLSDRWKAELWLRRDDPAGEP
jgi:hypothetical protein